MRKYVFIALSVFLLLTFAVFVYAQEPQIKFGGRIMVRGWYFSNATFSEELGKIGQSTNTYSVPGKVYAKDENYDTALYTSNISLTFDAKVAENVQGFLELEAAHGENPQSGLYIWAANHSGFQNYDAKPNADLRFRQAWIQYGGSGLLGVPAGVKVGHQLLTLGEKQFLNHERFGDDAIVVFVNPTNEITLAGVIAKLNEGKYTHSGDDIDAYVLLGTYKVDKDNTIGAYYFYSDCDDLRYAFEQDYYNDFDALSLQDVGLHANGKIGGILDYAAEVDGQFGKAKAQPSGIEDQKYRGFAVYLKGGYKVPDTPINLRASFAYGSGDNNLNDGKIKEFQSIMGFDSETAIARFVHYTQIYERTIATAALIQTAGGNGRILPSLLEEGRLVYPHRNTGIANTTYYNLGVDLAATKDLSMSLDGYILRASKVGAWRDLVGESVSKNIGWELDFKGSYKLAKNLTYFVEAGTFKPGKFYEDTKMVESKSTVSQVIHGLNLTF